MFQLVAQAMAQDEWSQVFFGLDAGQRFVLILVAIGCLTGVVISLAAIAAGAVQVVHRRRTEMLLRREMIDRGMTAEEIQKVMESASPPESGVDRWMSGWGKCGPGRGRRRNSGRI